MGGKQQNVASSFVANCSRLIHCAYRTPPQTREVRIRKAAALPAAGSWAAQPYGSPPMMVMVAPPPPPPPPQMVYVQQPPQQYQPQYHHQQQQQQPGGYKQ